MFCRQQLADFQSSLESIQSEGVSILAGSVDPPDKAEEMIAATGVSFPVAYGLGAEDISRSIGVYYNPEAPYLHAAGFILTPDGTVAVGCYSTGPIGRLTARDALALIIHFKNAA